MYLENYEHVYKTILVFIASFQRELTPDKLFYIIALKSPCVCMYI